MEPTEFEWFAGVAAELAEKTMHLKKEDIENASFFYNSDVRCCIGRIRFNGSAIYFLLDYPKKTFAEAGTPLEKKLKDLDSFIIQTEGQTAIIYKLNEEIAKNFNLFMN
jgi:hypothetical protein